MFCLSCFGAYISMYILNHPQSGYLMGEAISVNGTFSLNVDILIYNRTCGCSNFISYLV